MILSGPTPCLPSPATVQELFSVARDAGVLPHISLDPVLSSFLSLDSSAALQHHYNILQRGMSLEQRVAFGRSLTGQLGGSGVVHGGVGVVALALSLLLEQVAQQVRGGQNSTRSETLSPHRVHTKKMFGISTSSRIGWIVHNYLRLVPGAANNREKMAVTTELYDGWLKVELLDHYERMTAKKRMSSVSMQQWLTGAAVHLHVRIHQVRLLSVPPGSAESLRLAYKSGFSHLLRGYAVYLRRNIQETAAPRPRTAGTRPDHGRAPTSNRTDTSCSSDELYDAGRVNEFNETRRLNSTSCETLRASPTLTVDDGLTPDGREAPRGLLVIEPGRSVSHDVQHRDCESAAIQQALVPRIIGTQDLEHNRSFFVYSEKTFQGLLRQRQHFHLRTNQTQKHS